MVQRIKNVVIAFFCLVVLFMTMQVAFAFLGVRKIGRNISTVVPADDSNSKFKDITSPNSGVQQVNPAPAPNVANSSASNMPGNSEGTGNTVDGTTDDSQLKKLQSLPKPSAPTTTQMVMEVRTDGSLVTPRNVSIKPFISSGNRRNTVNRALSLQNLTRTMHEARIPDSEPNWQNYYCSACTSIEAGKTYFSCKCDSTSGGSISRVNPSNLKADKTLQCDRCRRIAMDTSGASRRFFMNCYCYSHIKLVAKPTVVRSVVKTPSKANNPKTKLRSTPPAPSKVRGSTTIIKASPPSTKKVVEVNRRPAIPRGGTKNVSEVLIVNNYYGKSKHEEMFKDNTNPTKGELKRIHEESYEMQKYMDRKYHTGEVVFIENNIKNRKNGSKYQDQGNLSYGNNRQKDNRDIGAPSNPSNNRQAEIDAEILN